MSVDAAENARLPILGLVGPTGSGKTAIGIQVALAFAESGTPVEIISADAMQLYRGMDIGTAKATADERQRVEHHLLDMWDPQTEASVEEYQRQARTQIRDCHTRGVIPLLVGGSGLYVSSVVYDFQFPGHDPEIRADLEADLESSGLGPLVARLREADPAVAAAVDLNNPRRVVRALEIMELTGEAPSASLEARGKWWHEPTVLVGLDAPRDWLTQRIDARTEAMWQAGLVDEVRGLIETGLGPTAAQAIGYREVAQMLVGEISETEARTQVAQHTKRYARKQMSWFRRDSNIHWVDASVEDAQQRVHDAFRAAFDKTAR